MFGVPVEWRLGAMSRETSQYKAYPPGDGNSGPHWSTNTSDAGGGWIGFTAFTPAIAAKASIGQLDDVQIYFQNTIKHFRIATPLAAPEDFCCVVYAPGIGGKRTITPGNIWGRRDTKKTQLDIYRNSLKGYDMPDPPGADEILGSGWFFLVVGAGAEEENRLGQNYRRPNWGPVGAGDQLPNRPMVGAEWNASAGLRSNTRFGNDRGKCSVGQG